jgi:hypothetical protein
MSGLWIEELVLSGQKFKHLLLNVFLIWLLVLKATDSQSR